MFSKMSPTELQADYWDYIDDHPDNRNDRNTKKLVLKALEYTANKRNLPSLGKRKVSAEVPPKELWENQVYTTKLKYYSRLL